MVLVQCLFMFKDSHPLYSYTAEKLFSWDCNPLASSHPSTMATPFPGFGAWAAAARAAWLHQRTLQKLMGYFNQSMVSSVAASLSCLQVQSTLPCVYLPPKAYWFCFMDYSIVRVRERFVGMYTLRLGVWARELEELWLCNVPFTPHSFSHHIVYLVTRNMHPNKLTMTTNMFLIHRYYT